MSLNEEARLLYLKSSFKLIDESNAEDFYKARAGILGHSFNPVNDENEAKRGRWFYLLRGINTCIQFDTLPIEEQEKIFKDWQAHPYYAYYEDKELVSNLFQNRKVFKETLANVEPGIAKIFYGLYHLHSEAKANANREVEEIFEIEEKCIKMKEVIKVFKQKLPILYSEYGKMFQAINLKTFERRVVGRKKSSSSFFQNLPWYFYFIFAYCLIKIIALIQAATK